ncbi:hypothetical protein DFH09DRAFT_1313235 [Mycena vulgaris]|nr:hypothetical protein DFH09DRAFT_1313235 [Mycena vulgaris]
MYDEEVQAVIDAFSSARQRTLRHSWTREAEAAAQRKEYAALAAERIAVITELYRLTVPVPVDRHNSAKVEAERPNREKNIEGGDVYGPAPRPMRLLVRANKLALFLLPFLNENLQRGRCPQTNRAVPRYLLHNGYAASFGISPARFFLPMHLDRAILSSAVAAATSSRRSILSQSAPCVPFLRCNLPPALMVTSISGVID